MNTIFQKLVLVFALLLVSCTSSSPPEAVTFQIHWEPTMDFLGFYVALGNGYYAEEGLDVTIQPLSDVAEGVSVPEQVATGKFDYATGGGDLLRAQGAGEPLVAMGSFIQFSPAAFFARADSGIVTPADFAGHSIVLKGSSWQRLLDIILDAGGLTEDDVEVVEGGYDMTPFLDGEVNIWAGFISDEVVLARMAGLEIVTFPLYDYGNRGSAVTIYTNQDHLDNQGDQVEGFVRASVRGWRWAVENPEKAVDVFLKLNPDLADERDFYIASMIAIIPLVIPPGTDIGHIDCELWRASKEFTNLESRDGLCTTEILKQATAD